MFKKEHKMLDAMRSVRVFRTAVPAVWLAAICLGGFRTSSSADVPESGVACSI
jgi:hypothetical protein